MRNSGESVGLCSEKSLHVATFSLLSGWALWSTTLRPHAVQSAAVYTLLCYHKLVSPCTTLIASLQHHVNTLFICTVLCTDPDACSTTFVSVHWRLLRFCRDRYAGRLRCALIKLREVHIDTNSMLRYDYKEFSAALGKRVKQMRKERGLTLRALVVQHGFHLTQIQRIEKGDGVSVPTLLRIAEVFQIPVEKLIAGLGLVEGGESRSKSSKK